MSASDRSTIPRSRRAILWAIASIIILLLAFVGYNAYTIRRFMSPYYKLVREQATEQEAVAQQGRPSVVITTDQELRPWADNFKPYQNVEMKVDGKVLIYCVTLWGEYHVVYLFVSRKGIVADAALGC